MGSDTSPIFPISTPRRIRQGLRTPQEMGPEAQLAPPTLAPTTPWTGRHLDPNEMQRLLWRSPARMIAVLGNRGTGKTCLLTSFFLQLATGQRGPFSYRFAGSQTLQGLHGLTERAAGWDGATTGQIVDATPQSESDAPRLFLHLALRPEAPEDERWHWTLVVLVAGFLLVVDIAFFSANAIKIPEGGWASWTAATASWC